MYIVSIVIHPFVLLQFEYMLTCRVPPGAVFYPAWLPQDRKTLNIWNLVSSKLCWDLPRVCFVFILSHQI